MGTLSDIYDNIKKETGGSSPVGPMGNPTNLVQVTSTPSLQTDPGTQVWRAQAKKEADRLSDECMKKILLHIYISTNPSDTDHIQGNMGQYRNDIDQFLQTKGQSATQYLTSAKEKTESPLVEFIIRSCKNIGRQFLEDAEETLKDAQTNNIDVPPPVADEDSEETEGQLIDIQKDQEYDTFIQKLKSKTIDKIVQDVTEIINKRDDEQNMTFDLKPDGGATATLGAEDPLMDDMGMGGDIGGGGPDLGGEPPAPPNLESTVSIGVDYIHNKLWKENVEIEPDMFEEKVLGLAIREACLFHIDKVFEQPFSTFREFASRIRFGKGTLVTESAVLKLIMEATGCRPLSNEERSIASKKFGDFSKQGVKIECGPEGFFASKGGKKTECYKSITEMPKSVVDFASAI